MKKRAVITGKHTDSGFLLLRNEKNFAYSLVYFKDRVGGGDVWRVADGEEGRITESGKSYLELYRS